MSSEILAARPEHHRQAVDAAAFGVVNDWRTAKA